MRLEHASVGLRRSDEATSLHRAYDGAAILTTGPT
jgi:hypothetical protein